MPSQKETVYTIGYSGFTIAAFTDVLKRYAINVLIDVRSTPYSQFHSEYNQETLSAILKRNGIFYRNYAHEFGARQEDRAFYPNGYLDFELFAASDAFREGFRKLENTLRSGYRFALMCAEKDPYQCHRSMMVARSFSDAGYPVVHILPDGETTQSELECRLIEQYFPNRNQLSMFEEPLSTEDCIRRAYRLRNREIAYTMEGEDA